MLPDVNRMRRRTDFDAAVRRGGRAGRPTLVVHLGQSEVGDDPRIGFVVSRAVGNAVVRNRVRRRLRHLMRGRLHRVPRGSLVVVRANPAAAEATFATLDADLDRALERALRKRGGDRR